MRRLRLLAAISAGLALAAGAMVPLPASTEALRGTATGPLSPGDAATVRLITGALVAMTLRVEASYDDGRTWTTARTTAHGDLGFRAELTTPAQRRTWVTLRVTASDSTGNTVRQTVPRAYAVHW
ncbi:hypothetical protein [Streptomyces parvus]|uniref:hypothetical protein n=1 Tax=Streptomyces parvus TaxID=66428 RepID=UPI0033223E39